MIIGILGLQGCCLPHARAFADLGVDTRRVVYPHDLEEIDALVLPGGESTTMLKTAEHGLWDALREFGQAKPLWGVCAGCILMAKHVDHPPQPSLALLDIDVTRNAYGSQIDSFVRELQLDLPSPTPLECIFIRAPVVRRVGDGIEVLAREGERPVMLESPRHLVTTFHPELTNRRDIHAYFVDKVAAQ